MDPNVVQVADGVHFVEASHTNLVIVEDGEGYVLIDTGYPRDRRLLIAAITSIGRRPADCGGLLLTHCHVDHTGSAAWLQERAGVEVHCHAEEEAQVTGPIRQQISPATLVPRLLQPGVAMFTLHAVMAGGLRRAAVAEATTFEGERAALDLPGGPVAVHTPGHTDGHVAFQLPSRGALISGDALCTVNVWDESDTGPQLLAEPFYADHAQAVASLGRLEGLEADVVVPGHGAVYRGTPAEAVAEARTRLG